MFTPILSKHELPKFNLFGPRPMGEPGIAIVLFQDHGSSTALSPGQPLSAADLAWGKYRGYYRVDVGRHEFTFNVRLPSREHSLNFETSANMEYSVAHPSVVVDRQIHDPESMLRSRIVEKMRIISRKYNIEESEDAEFEINNQIQSGVEFDGVLLTRISVELTPDVEALGHIRGRGIDRLQQEREKGQIKFYASLINEGEWELLAMKLAKNPDDVGNVVEWMQQQKRRELDNYIYTIKELIDADVIEDNQVTGEAKKLLGKLADRLGIADGKKLLEDNEKDSKRLSNERGKKHKRDQES